MDGFVVLLVLCVSVSITSCAPTSSDPSSENGEPANSGDPPFKILFEKNSTLLTASNGSSAADVQSTDNGLSVRSLTSSSPPQEGKRVSERSFGTPMRSGVPLRQQHQQQQQQQQLQQHQIINGRYAPAVGNDGQYTQVAANDDGDNAIDKMYNSYEQQNMFKDCCDTLDGCVRDEYAAHDYNDNNYVGCPPVDVFLLRNILLSTNKAQSILRYIKIFQATLANNLLSQGKVKRYMPDVPEAHAEGLDGYLTNGWLSGKLIFTVTRPIYVTRIVDEASKQENSIRIMFNLKIPAYQVGYNFALNYDQTEQRTRSGAININGINHKVSVSFNVSSTSGRCVVGTPTIEADPLAKKYITKYKVQDECQACASYQTSLDRFIMVKSLVKKVFKTSLENYLNNIIHDAFLKALIEHQRKGSNLCEDIFSSMFPVIGQNMGMQNMGMQNMGMQNMGGGFHF